MMSAMKAISRLFFCLLTLTFMPPLTALMKGDSFLTPQQKSNKKIFINNRILAKVNGKSISTYDLMKKLDLTFYRQYPQFASSVDARYQFYEMSWQPALSEMIDKELILADADESNITVSSGDIRQEIETAFGPNIIANLDKAGLTYEEAAKLMQDEILMRRLLSGRVHAKAMRLVTPAKVRAAYESYIEDPKNKRNTQWSYRIITVKEKNLEKGEAAAKAAYQLLLQGTPIDQLAGVMKEQKIISKNGSVTLSSTIKQLDTEVSKEVHEALSPLQEGGFSEPFAQRSKASRATVYRILAMEEIIPGGAPPYREMEVMFKEKLLDQEIDKETDAYLLKLRQHYHISEQDFIEQLPEGYQPFILR